MPPEVVREVTKPIVRGTSAVTAVTITGTATVTDDVSLPAAGVNGTLTTTGTATQIAGDYIDSRNFLQSILEEASSRLLSLNENWDYDGALKINQECIKNAEKFLIDNLKFFDPLVPAIAPYTDGSVDIIFQDSSIRLLITISLDEIYTQYVDLYAKKNTEDKNSERLRKWLPSLIELNSSYM